MDKTTIIKIGGSVITDKTKICTPKLDNIKRLVAELKKYINESNEKIIIVSGGGSFPHPVAKKYYLKEGIYKSMDYNIDIEDAKLGFALCTKAASKINELLWEELLNINISAISFRTSSIVIAKSGEIDRIFLDPLKQILKMDILPLLFGDAVFDIDWGCTIISGEQLIKELTNHFTVQRIIVCANVDGVYTKDPFKYRDGKIIKNIGLDNLNLIDAELKGTFNSMDVTGGMDHKVNILKELLIKKGIKSSIINGNVPQNLYKALKGEAIGTTFSVE